MINNFTVSATKIGEGKKTLSWFLTRSCNPEERKKKRSKSLRENLGKSECGSKIKERDGKVRISDELLAPWDFENYDIHEEVPL